MNETTNVYHMLHPEMADPEYLAKCAQRHGREFVPPITREQAMANLIESMAEKEEDQASKEDCGDVDPIQKMREKFAREEQDAPAKRAAKAAAEETELRARAAMSQTFCTGPACQKFTRAIANISKVLPPFDEAERAKLPGYEENAITELVHAVWNAVGPEAFSVERLYDEALAYCNRVRNPISGVGSGSVPRHQGCTVLGGSTSKAGATLDRWCDYGTQAEEDIERQRLEEAHRTKQLNMNRARGFSNFGAIAHRRF